MFGIENAQSLVGLAVTLVLCWAISEDRRRFPWRLALGAIAIQVGLVLLLFGVPAARGALQGMSGVVDGLGTSTQAGTRFVFGFLAGGDQPYPVGQAGLLFIFAFRVLPVILVICALSALLWHWKILRWLTRGFGFLFQKTMGLRGPPALAVAATVFMGQVEGPIFIRAYLERLTRSELFLLLAVGMSCVSGSTMVAYALILKGVLANAAAHVLTASLISAPAGVLLARVIVPPAPAERQDDFDHGALKDYASSVDALISGTSDGLTIVLNVGATLIVVVALMAMADQILALLPPIAGAPPSIERALGVLFSPLAWSLGIRWSEAPTAGSLLGLKLVLTEFTAFFRLSQLDAGAFSERSRMIMTYALCGFGNVASVGINVAGYGVLVPARRAEVIALVWKALAAGFLATCMTASVVGAMPAGLFGG
ncbi:MAG: nucleoside transporter C-terminal domain-containing protein [Caulobacteraceae bacterium]|nr:nucleoside transporter C-terminal domain-containing protein [Caulobacteraceae bacterium]